MVVLNAKTTTKSEKCKAATETDVDKHTKLVCYRCGKPNHTSKECTSRAFICYNCKELTTNPYHTLQHVLNRKQTIHIKLGTDTEGKVQILEPEVVIMCPCQVKVLKVEEDHLVDPIDTNMDIVQTCLSGLKYKVVVTSQHKHICFNR